MSRISSFLKDAGRFGLRPAFQAVTARYASAPAVIDLPRFGRFHVRGRDSDIATLRQVFGEQEYRLKIPAIEARMEKRYRQMLAAGQVPVIIDAGANVGAAARWFHLAFPEARVIAVEPDAANAAMLRLNTEAFAAISVAEAAIGAEAGFVSLIPADAAWGIRTERAETGLAIVTIPELVASVENGALFLAKIDIEGFEEDLFASATDWVDDAFCVIVEPHDWMLPDQHTSRTFQQVMGQRDFQVLIQGENLLYVRPEAA